MSRELKFRVWDVEEKCWIPKDQYLIDYEGYLYTGKDNCYLLEMIDYKISQFTGLLDKNGKEIYEGDVLKIEKLHPLCSNKLSATYVIEWENLGFKYKILDEVQMNGCGYLNYDPIYNIIGNIFENPELLV